MGRGVGQSCRLARQKEAAGSAGGPPLARRVPLLLRLPHVTVHAGERQRHSCDVAAGVPRLHTERLSRASDAVESPGSTGGGEVAVDDSLP